MDLTYFEVCWSLKEVKGTRQAASEDEQTGEQERDGKIQRKGKREAW